jgi:hypothetical protein
VGQWNGYGMHLGVCSVLVHRRLRLPGVAWLVEARRQLAGGRKHSRRRHQRGASCYRATHTCTD